jgi:hypothetical protein
MPLYEKFIGEVEPNDGNKFEWVIGKIDVEFQHERYTPVYNQNAGIENGRFVTQA